MSDNEHGPTQDQMEFTNVPDEIFEHHIWKQFSFDAWIRVFSLVCKKWKRICEESTVDPKQIRIVYKNSHGGGKLLKIVHKYQPTILRVMLEYMADLFFVHWLCKASKRLHTLVLFKHSDPQFYFKMDVDPFDMYVKPIKNITTLAVKIEGSENFWQNLQIIFPNLKRLQVEHPNQLFNSNAEHFTLIHYDEIIIGKIVDLRDWSNHFASTANFHICYVMAAAGCQIPVQEFRQLGMQLDVGFIIEVIAKQHPTNLFDALLYYPLYKLKGVANKINIDFTIEKDGDSLFNKRMQLYVSTEEELIEYKHLVNHMDSSGRTPLLITIEHPPKPAWDTVKKLLELGADPTKHRGDKLSPLGLLLAKGSGHRNMYTYDVINIANLLVEYGADVNAPCLYQERMCSPLMIAVLNGSSNDIIIRLIILGARTDYVDETGRTIMDCCVH